MGFKNKTYFFIFVIGLAILFVIIALSYKMNNTYKTKSKEGFVTRLHQIYRPYVRHFNVNYESFINNYGPAVIFTKLRKWNVY